LIAEFQEATTSTLAREMLGRALAFADADDCYQALKLARRVMLHEQEVMGLAPAVPARRLPRRRGSGLTWGRRRRRPRAAPRPRPGRGSQGAGAAGQGPAARREMEGLRQGRGQGDGREGGAARPEDPERAAAGAGPAGRGRAARPGAAGADRRPKKSDGLLARLPDGRWKAAAATLNLHGRGVEALRDPKVQASLADGLRRLAWRDELDSGQPGVGDAMLFRERAASAKTAYDALGDPVLRRVLTAALGLPQGIVVQPIEAQARASPPGSTWDKLQNPREVAKLAERYVVAAAGSVGGGAAGAASPLLDLFPAGGLLA
jgi:hypothetical protein